MRPRAALAATAAVTAALALAAGCSSGAAAQGEQACVHVNRSIVLFQASMRQHDAGTASADQRQAQSQLLVAEPLAAAANSSDGSWNGLMTTLIESERVSEANLIVALQSECAGVVPGNSGNSGTTGTTAGPGNGNGNHAPSSGSGPTLPPQG